MSEGGCKLESGGFPQASSDGSSKEAEQGFQSSPTDGGEEMRAVPDLPATAPFYYQVPSLPRQLQSRHQHSGSYCSAAT